MEDAAQGLWFECLINDTRKFIPSSVSRLNTARFVTGIGFCQREVRAHVMYLAMKYSSMTDLRQNISILYLMASDRAAEVRLIAHSLFMLLEVFSQSGRCKFNVVSTKPIRKEHRRLGPSSFAYCLFALSFCWEIELSPPPHLAARSTRYGWSPSQ